jgi:lysophospholipase L1-like esterase
MAGPRPTTRRRLGRRLLAVSLGAAAALATAEVAYRGTRVRHLSPTTHPAYVRHDPELGWAYRPGARARHRSAEFDVEIAINRQGFRGPDWPPRDARPLVLLLGDSIVFGWGVEEAEGLCGWLRTRHPEWDVRGAGVSGYAPDQQLLLLRHLRTELRPDIVVCVSCSNDGYEAASDFVYGLHKPRFARRDHDLQLVARPGPEGLLHAHSLLWRALTKLVWRWQFSRRPAAHDWDLVAALYGAMQAETPDARFLLVGTQPPLQTLTPEKFACLPLAELLPAGGPWTFPIDTHWNAAGHARVAAAVADWIAAALRGRSR